MKRKTLRTKPSVAAMVVSVLVLALVPLRSAPAADTEAVERLRAFAKLYGYVRFFHPSDRAAEVDWEQFAVDGAATILEADGQEDLQRTLNRLFRRIAPTVRIVRSDEPPTWLLGSPQQVDPSRVVAWQHVGVDLGNPGYYMSIRTNRPNFLPPTNFGFGGISQSISATAHVGRDVRLRAAVRAEVEGIGNQAQLFLSVQDAGNEVIFWDGMDDRPITLPDWNHYEIVGSVGEDGHRIYFGAFLNRVGVARFDDISLAVREPGGEWQVVPIANPGFEDHSSDPQGWWTDDGGYSYTVDNADAFAGSQSLEISYSTQGEPAPELLFDQVPSVGEKVLKDLGAGLWAVVPVALPVTPVRRAPRRVVPGTTENAHRAVMTRAPAKISASASAERVAAVVIAWNILQHFYPYFDVIDTDWEAELDSALSGALDAANDRQFFRTLQLLLAALHDGHASVHHSGLEYGRAKFPIAVEWIEDQVVVTASEISEVMIGDVVVSVDGQSAVAMIENDMSYRSGTTQWRRRRSLREFGYGNAGSSATLVVRRGDDARDLTLERTFLGFSPAEPRPQAIEEVEDGVFYVDLTRATIAKIWARAFDLAAATGVIFDLRGYPNYNDDVISYLIDEDVLSARWNVSQIIYPDRDRIVGWDTSGRWVFVPHEPHFQGTPVFLTDDRAISYAETVMGIIEAYDLAEIVGRTTAGTNGDVNPFVLPGGFQVYWTGLKVLKHDGSQHHLVGIIPTVPVQRTIAAVREGRDEDLEMAIEIIHQKQQFD